MHIIEQAKSLLDFNQKLDISLLDGVINLMYTGQGDAVNYDSFISFVFKLIVFQFENRKAKTSRRGFEQFERTSGCMDSSGHHIGILTKPTDQILRFANLGENHKNQMESVAKKSMRSHQEVHSWFDHQELVRSDRVGKGESLFEQVEYHSDSGSSLHFVFIPKTLYDTICLV
jgi:hypothetical protein